MDDHIELFHTSDARNMLRNKYVLFIGDSVIRAMYKDMVKLLQSSELLKEQQLKTKGEFYFENDVLLEGGQKGIMSNEITYTEIRQFCQPDILVKFYFVTRCYSDYLMSVCEDLKRDAVKPDVVIMNSGCWDLTRYGPNSRQEYRRNLPMGIYSLLQVLPDNTLFIWTTTLPLSKEVRGGFMNAEAECMQSRLRQDVLDANFYASHIMRDLNVDLIDMHYYFKSLIKHRKPDGIHWDVIAHRRITNILLSHVSECWGYDMVCRAEFKKRIEADAENFVDDDEEFVDSFYDDYVEVDWMMPAVEPPPPSAQYHPPPLMHMTPPMPNNMMAPFPMNPMNQGYGAGLLPMPPPQYHAPVPSPMMPFDNNGRPIMSDLGMIHNKLMAAAHRHQIQPQHIQNSLSHLMSFDMNHNN